MKETITIEWHWTDIEERAKEFHEYNLTKEECCHILECIENSPDANIGINWSVIDWHIEDYHEYITYHEWNDGRKQ